MHMHVIHAIHHATMAGMTISDLCKYAMMHGLKPSELLAQSWLRLAASELED